MNKFENKNADGIEINLRHIAHELASPLNALSFMNTQLLRIISVEDDRSRNIVQRQGRIIGRMTCILQDVFQGNDAINSVILTEIDPLFIFSEVQISVAPQLVEAEIDLSLSVSDSHKQYKVFANIDLVIQILVILVNNSIDSLALFDDASEKWIKIIFEPTLKHTFIHIIDGGAGVAEEIIPLLFKEVQSTKPKGCGVGLSIAKQIVSRMGGSIEYVPGGSVCRFRICIPNQC